MSSKKRNRDSNQTIEKQDEEVPRGDLDMIAHHILMIASFDGYCYLVNKESSKIYWRVQTNGLLYTADRGEKVDDYADLKQRDFNSKLYHFHPNKPNGQRITDNTEDGLKDYFNQHYKEDEKAGRDSKELGGTYVSKKEKYYLINYQKGLISHSFDSSEKILENKDLTNKQLMIERVDFNLRRSSPSWSLQFARIKAWFFSPASVRTECVVHHAPNLQSYIKACEKFTLKQLPGDCAINQLIMGTSSLSLEKEKLKEENENLKKENSDLGVELAKNRTLNVNKSIKIDRVKEIEFFHGQYDGVDALIEKAKSMPDDLRKTIIVKLRSIPHHPNICTFLGSKSDKNHDYFAYEKCRKTLKDYIKEPKTRYEEMSEQSIQIMSGLVSGISHLHTRKLVHKNLSLDNIWMSDDNTIKIGGVVNSESIKGDGDKDRLLDLYEVGQALLGYMSKDYNPPPDKTLLSEVQFDKLGIKGTNKEALDLLQKLHVVAPEPTSTLSPARLCKHIAFWPATERLGFFQDLSSYLEETTPKPKLLRKALMSLTVVPGGNPRSDWRTRFNEGVVKAMEKVHEKSVKPAHGTSSNSEHKQKDPSEEKKTTVTYEYTNPVSLIRFIRNGYIHIQSFSSRVTTSERTLADDLGSNASMLEQTFRSAFPGLFVSVYAEVEKHLNTLPDHLKKHYQA